METSLEDVVNVLTRTPAVLRAMLSGMPDAWLDSNEGPETFSARDVVGHLIHGEKTDWIPRLRRILSDGENKPFDPFDRTGFKDASDTRINSLLKEFETLRSENLRRLREANLSPEQFALRGRHPALGVVTLGQLLSTWAIHDINHLGQIARVLSKNYIDEVGPWKQYLGILNR